MAAFVCNVSLFFSEINIIYRRFCRVEIEDPRQLDGYQGQIVVGGTQSLEFRITVDEPQVITLNIVCPDLLARPPNDLNILTGILNHIIKRYNSGLIHRIQG